MNNDFKPLIWAGTLTLLFLSFFLLVEINQVSSTAATTNTVSFSGTGKIMATPDIAMISATVVTQAADTTTAQNQNTTRSNAVTAFLKKQGIAAADIQTSGYNIYPQYGYPQPCPLSSSGIMIPCQVNQTQITTYQVTQSFSIKVRDLTKVGTILAGLVSAGANQVNNLGLQIDNPEMYQDQARQMAIADAKKKAAQMESEVGFKLGRIINFSDNSGGQPVPIMYDATVGSKGGGSVAPTISPGQNTITDDVIITYQIK